MENNGQIQYNDGRIIVPYDKDRKKVTFYDTYVDINGDIVRYDDIAVFQSEALDSDSQILFYFSKSFSYNFSFTTYDGTKHELNRMGYSAYGIGTYKRVKNEFEPVADPMYDIVLKKVFERICERIENGATVKICGLTIAKDKITLEKRKQTVVIDIRATSPLRTSVISPWITAHRSSLKMRKGQFSRYLSTSPMQGS